MVTGTNIIKEEDTTTYEEDNKFDTGWGVSTACHGDMIQLANTIIKGQAVAVSNGSFQEQHGSVAWTIEGTSSQHQIIGKGRTPGTQHNQSTYHSELFGL